MNQSTLGKINPDGEYTIEERMNALTKCNYLQEKSTKYFREATELWDKYKLDELSKEKMQWSIGDKRGDDN